MLKYPEIDPVALSLGSFELFGKVFGPINIHWYGLMYLFGFAAAWLLGTMRTKKPYSPVTKAQVEDLIFFGAMGVVIGARIGYIFFYNFSAFLDNPGILFRVWEGGMSFHGGLIGVIIAMIMFSRKIKRPFIDVMDFTAPLVPIGLGLGRLGNFIGGELWGRETDVSWGMVFPKDVDQLVRHPSQLYQAFFEGLVLFIILFWFSRKPRPRYAVASLFLICYGCFRFGVEFVRQPDAHIGYQFGWMTRGQILSLPMIIIGLIIFFAAYRFASGNAKTETVEATK
ncbi:prolipoprotein diacylglyceryl transferase [Agarilytica rhodophyticola]|uniref:prolipoprotein diacylglyceryl transferase n=1 Tax=Agarilytica rhodophyticola TaxID=1737490 RepID=UPI000B348240|nr:prolipoprotein diacylglyceryl transferase [Agarilytica rhodophyticola]